MSYKTIRYEEERAGLVGILTLNRPERLNAIMRELIEEVHDCVDALETKTTPRVLILTGAGRAFCAGFDLKSATEKRESGATYSVEQAHNDQRRLADLIIKLRKIPQPVIAAVNGVAAGGGFSISMAADIRIADPSARFIASYVNIGLGGGEMGSAYFLPRLIGLSRAADILYTGRDFTAEEAAACGFVSRLSPPGGTLNAALELADTMLDKSPFSLRMTKEVLNQTIDAPSLESAIYLENRTQTLATLTDNFKEAIQAFVEKRPPEFKS